MLHLIVKAGQGSKSVCDVVATELGNLELARHLISLGSVYRAVGNGNVRTMDPDVRVVEGQYLRVHPNPRRYPAEAIAWRETVQFENDDLLVLNKPPGLPCCPTVDNQHENVLQSVIRQFGLSEAFLPHRLDTDTTGLLILTKNKKACAAVSSSLSNRTGVTKHYRALVASEESESPLHVGQHLIHYLLPSSRSPKIFTKQPYTPPAGSPSAPSSVECLSRVVALSACRVSTVAQWKQRAAAAAAAAKTSAAHAHLQLALTEWFSSKAQETSVTFQEVTLELTTGRTHQARGQLSSIGSGACHSNWHIAGDNNYAGTTTLPSSKIDGYRSSPFLALQSAYLKLPLPSHNGERHRNAASPATSAGPSDVESIEVRLPDPWWSPLVAAEQAEEH